MGLCVEMKCSCQSYGLLIYHLGLKARSQNVPSSAIQVQPSYLHYWGYIYVKKFMFTPAILCCTSLHGEPQLRMQSQARLLALKQLVFRLYQESGSYQCKQRCKRI